MMREKMVLPATECLPAIMVSPCVETQYLASLRAGTKCLPTIIVSPNKGFS